MPTYSARVEYTASGGETNFAFAFGYLEEAHVKLYINDVVDSSATLQNNDPNTGGEIVPSVTINASDAIVVVRETPSGILVDYQNAAALTEDDLDLAYRHGLYVAEEAEDTAVIAETIAAATTVTVTAAEVAAQAAQAAAEAAQTAAETAETNAATSESNAATSETNAAASEAAALAAVGGVSVSANDTTPSNLEAKLLVGTGLTLSTQNEGANETRTISVGDANGDLLLGSGSVSAGATDADLNLGGNRAVLDYTTGSARVGAASGGGAALALALHVNGTNVMVTDANSNNKTFYGGTRFSAGLEFGESPLGSLSSTTALIGWASAEICTMTIGASVIINFSAVEAGYHFTKTLQITQDGTGGRTPTFQRLGTTSQIQWTTTEPNWSGMAAGEVWRVTAQYLDNWLYLSAVKVKS